MLHSKGQSAAMPVTSTVRDAFIDCAICAIDRAVQCLAEESCMSDSLQQFFIVVSLRSAEQLRLTTPCARDARRPASIQAEAVLDSFSTHAGESIAKQVKKNLCETPTPSSSQWIKAFARGLDYGTAELMRSAARLAHTPDDVESLTAIGETMGRITEMLTSWSADARVAEFAGAVCEAVAGPEHPDLILVAGQAVKSAASDLSDIAGFPVQAIHRAMDDLILVEPLDSQWLNLCKGLGNIIARSADTSIARKRRAGALQSDDLMDEFEQSMSQAMQSCRLVWVMSSTMPASYRKQQQ